MSRPSVSPLRTLGAFDGSMIVVGTIIGGGIFFLGGEIAKKVHSPGMLLAVWVAGGVLALCGAAATAELGALFPRGGGEYVYLRQAYGGGVGFLSGWTSFWAGFPGSVAFLAAAMGRSICELVGQPPGIFETAVATAIVVAITVLNCFGLRLGKWAQNVLSLAKIGAFAVLIVVGAIWGKGDHAHFQPFFSGEDSAHQIGLALIPIFFAYTGWNGTAYLAGEMRDPGKNLSRSLVWGTLICIVLYLAVNVIYLYAMPVASMKLARDLGQAAAARLFEPATGIVVAALVPMVILGSLQATVIQGPRIYQAMAEDGLFFAPFARLHARYRVPVLALVVQGLVSCVLLWTGTFGQLLTFTSVVIMIFSMLTVAAVYVLRVRKPDLARPYRALGYPVTPAVYIAGSLWILGNVFATGALEALAGMGIVASGIPVYYWYRSRRRESAPG